MCYEMTTSVRLRSWYNLEKCYHHLYHAALDPLSEYFLFLPTFIQWAPEARILYVVVLWAPVYFNWNGNNYLWKISQIFISWSLDFMTTLLTFLPTEEVSKSHWRLKEYLWAQFIFLVPSFALVFLWLHAERNLYQSTVRTKSESKIKIITGKALVHPLFSNCNLHRYRTTSVLIMDLVTYSFLDSLQSWLKSSFLSNTTELWILPTASNFLLGVSDNNLIYMKMVLLSFPNLPFFSPQTYLFQSASISSYPGLWTG